MKKAINTIQKTISIISAYGIAFFLFISTGGAWTNDANINLGLSDIIWRLLIITILASFILLFMRESLEGLMSKYTSYNILVFALCCITYLYQFRGDIYEFFNWFCLPILWFFLFLLLTGDVNIVWKAFVNVAILFSIISLFYYFFGTCIKLIPESGITEIYWGEWDTSAIRSFHNLYYEAQFLKTDGIRIIARNCGIFSEAPMYNFVLCVAMSIELFISKHTHWWKIILLFLTIITTFSTTGYLFLIIAGVMYLANIIFSESGLTVHKIAFNIVTLLGGLIVIGILIQKMSTISGAGSVNVRSDHLIACIKAWINSPIIGVGYENQSAIMEYEKYKQGISVGLPYLLATGGILMISMIAIPFIKIIKESASKRTFNILIFESLFLILYFFTAITYFPILRFFIAYILTVNVDDNLPCHKIDKFQRLIINKLLTITYTMDEFKSYIKSKKIVIITTGVILSIIFCVIRFIKREFWSIQTCIYALIVFISGFLLCIFFYYLLLFKPTFKHKEKS